MARTCGKDARPSAESRCHGCAANEAYVPYYEDQKKKPREAMTICFAQGGWRKAIENPLLGGIVPLLTVLVGNCRVWVVE